MTARTNWPGMTNARLVRILAEIIGRTVAITAPKGSRVTVMTEHQFEALGEALQRLAEVGE